MAQDATGTPTSPDSIPKYNTAVDAPSGRGFNAAMDAIQAALSTKAAAADVVSKPSGIAAGEVPVWNGSGWVRSSATNVGPTSLGSGTPDATKYLRGDGSWQVFTTPGVVTVFDHTPSGSGGATIDTNTILGGNIPSTYSHLQFVIEYLHDNSAALNLMLRFNNDATASYSDQYILLGGAGAVGQTERMLQTEGYTGGLFAHVPGWVASSTCSVEILIPNYANASQHQSWHFRGMRYNASGGTGALEVRAGAGVWRAAAAINRVQLFHGGGASGNWLNTSRVTLYGLK